METNLKEYGKMVKRKDMEKISIFYLEKYLKGNTKMMKEKDMENSIFQKKKLKIKKI